MTSGTVCGIKSNKSFCLTLFHIINSYDIIAKAKLGLQLLLVVYTSTVVFQTCVIYI